MFTYKSPYSWYFIQLADHVLSLAREKEKQYSGCFARCCFVLNEGSHISTAHQGHQREHLGKSDCKLGKGEGGGGGGAIASYTGPFPHKRAWE